MEITDNCFKLVRITTDGDIAYFIVELFIENEKVKQYYLDNYYEGLYIGKGNEKYNVYTVKSSGRIVGEIYYETICQNAIIEKKYMQLWAKLRFGNTIIYQSVQIGIEKADICFGHKYTYRFVTGIGNTFCFFDCSQLLALKNSYREEKDVFDVKINLTKETIWLYAQISERLSRILDKEMIYRELCLVWKDTQKKQIYYFHYEQIKANKLIYSIHKDEMDQIDRLEIANGLLDWILMDSAGREYKLYCAGNENEKSWLLPSGDFYARLYKTKDNTLAMHIMTMYFFHYRGVIQDGNTILLEFFKLSYPLRIISFFAQRVNTEQVYQLSNTIVSENEQKILFTVDLKFDEKEHNFRTGVYQFWVEIQDGTIITRYPLKVFREVPVYENTYLVSEFPYIKLDNYYYDCMIYFDNSNNLKCNIVPKILKIQIENLMVTSDLEIIFRLVIQKEPLFDHVSSFCLEAGNDKITYKSFSIVYEDCRQVAMEIRFSLKKLFKTVKDLLFRPMLAFNEREGWLYVQNNRYAPTISEREIKRISIIKQLGELDYVRIWGNQIGKSYAIGLSENMNLLTATDCYLEDERLVIHLSVNDNENHVINNDNVRLIVKDNYTQKEYIFSKVSLYENIYGITISTLNISDYMIYGQFDNGMISYLSLQGSISTIYSYECQKKIMVQKNNEAMALKVAEILIYEDQARIQQCMNIIEKAKKERKISNRKIWFVGENYALSARDNGLAFFEYCMKNKDKVDAEVYFVTKPENKDIDALAQYRRNVIIYDSDEHIFYDELTEFYIVSHGIRDVMPSLYHNSIDEYHRPVIYLQHGIIAMKKIGISNRSYDRSIRRFIVSSYYEKELLCKSKQFRPDEIAVTGLARYDKLIHNKKNTEKRIWVMPTWRDWLVKTEKDFINSDFFEYYRCLLESRELYNKLKTYNCKLVFSLHIEFEKYKHFFDQFGNDFILINNMHEKSVSECIKECSMVVSDYSSVIFDVVYLKKPVIFFQFDKTEYNKFRGSYINFDTDLPGEIIYTTEDLIQALIKHIQNGFFFERKFNERAEKFFEFNDLNNSKRIYDTILECRKELENEY